MRTLYDRLREYSDSDYYGFHMPGHKRQMNMMGDAAPYAIDITEIDGFDDLHHADGILKEAQARAARVYHADETHFLINGSSVGILSAVIGVTNRGDTVLVARNCHKSVYHAVEMNGLNPVYLSPGFDSSVQFNTEVSAEDVRTALAKDPGIRAVVIVSPTYDGVVSDVEAISEAVHEKGVPLIVDEAHGAHFGFHPYFPENANRSGADIVIHSLHKTLPSLTQTALLHMNGSLIRREKVRRYLHMLQSSSPSYVLMASIDSCIDLLENRREELFHPYVRRLERLRSRLSGLQRLRLEETEHYDRSKLLISVGDTGLTGRELYTVLLEEYHLQLEMAAGTYVLAMTSAGDTDKGMERLLAALEEIDSMYKGVGMSVRIPCSRVCGAVNSNDNRENSGLKQDIPCLPRPDVVYNSFDIAEMTERSRGTGAASEGAGADDKAWRTAVLPWKDSVGYVAAEYAYLYPPGKPLIVPGERISQEAADVLQWYRRMGFTIEGIKREGCIEVLMHG